MKQIVGSYKQVGKAKEKPGTCRIIISLSQIDEVNKQGETACENIHHRRCFPVYAAKTADTVVN